MMRSTALLGIVALATTLASASTSAQPRVTIPFVAIGQLDWMARNVDVTTFRNGDPIPRIDDPRAWAQAGRVGLPAVTTYPSGGTPPAAWGRLYNFAAIADMRGLSPAGWRVPADRDWAQLEGTLGAALAAGRLRSRAGWAGSGGGKDDVGFAALPAGFRTQRGDVFLAGRVAYFWSATSVSAQETTAHMLFDYDDRIFRIVYDKAMGMSLRCVRDRKP